MAQAKPLSDREPKIVLIAVAQRRNAIKNNHEL